MSPNYMEKFLEKLADIMEEYNAEFTSKNDGDIEITVGGVEDIRLIGYFTAQDIRKAAL